MTIPSELHVLRAAWTSERARVVRQIESLEHRFDDIVSAAELTSTDDEHDPEGATIAYERAQAGALLSRARTDLTAIDDASRRLAEGVLPICQTCQGPIGVERLLALPGTRACIRCAV